MRYLYCILDWAWSDQLTFTTVSSLLRLAVSHQEHRPTIMEAIFGFASNTVKQLNEAEGTLFIMYLMI